MVYIKDVKQEKIALEIAKKLKEANIIYNYEQKDYHKLPYGKKHPEKAYSIILYANENLEEIFEAIISEYRGFTYVEQSQYAIEINITVKSSIKDILNG